MGGTGAAGLHVRLLGPVRAFNGESEIDLGATGPRSLFAMLAMRANTTLTLDELVDGLWGEAPPKSAQGGVYTYVSTLRKALEPGRERRDQPRVLTGTRAGYSLLLPPRAVDAARCEQAAAEGLRRWSADDFAGALAQCDLALSEWEGSPLGRAVGPFAEAERSRLELLRLQVQECRGAALIETGAAGSAVASLSALAAGNPLRERSHELLMLALHRTGQQAEALEVYQRVREQLAGELGIEPGPALRQLHGRVLAGDRPAVSRTEAAARLVPAQLPHDVRDFIGRDDKVERLRKLCAAAAGSSGGGTAVLATVDGAAGSGKTAFAIHVAHDIADQFPDGQLFLDLRGFDPRLPPVTTEEALRHLLHGLSRDAQVLTADVATQAAIYRSLLAGRRVLVVLDNARSAEQVRPLLPGAQGCLVLVTSRNRLSGLAIRDGATRIGIGVLRPTESLELLRRVLGADQVDAEVDMARELAASCGHLPLALRIAAEHIVGSDHRGLADMVDELRAERDRLDVLAAPDDESSIMRAVFSWTYHALSPEERRAFRLLGLHPGVEVDAPQAAALFGTGTADARRQLDCLTRWNLLDQVGRDRYRFHDLVRTYAAECAEQEEPHATAQAAVERMLRWYLRSVVTAREVLAPGLGGVDVASPETGLPPAILQTYDGAINWVGERLSTLVELVSLAADRGFDHIAARFATALGALCHCVSRWTDWLRVTEIGQAAARRTGDRLSQARLHNDAGVVHYFLGREDEAVSCHRAAVAILADLSGPSGPDDPQDQATVANLAVAYSMMGRHLDSIPMLEDALRIARRQGNEFVEASVTENLGVVLSGLNRHAEAIEYGQRCVGLLRETGSKHMLGHGLNQLGSSCLRAGRVDEAIAHLGAALDVWRGLGDQWGQANGMRSLAKALDRAGRTDSAHRLVTEARAIMRESGYLAADHHGIQGTVM
ncbi:MAG: hypothetical protein QOF44_403 [Streptomyces sp.]|nr:hypothetical protein [Streptomyces sp.]